MNPRRLHGLDRTLQEIVGHRRFDLDLGQEVDDVFGAAIELGVPLLATEALDLGDGDALDTDRRQGLADLVELERFDDRSDELHDFLRRAGPRGAGQVRRGAGLRTSC